MLRLIRQQIPSGTAEHSITWSPLHPLFGQDLIYFCDKKLSFPLFSWEGNISGETDYMHQATVHASLFWKIKPKRSQTLSSKGRWHVMVPPGPVYELTSSAPSHLCRSKAGLLRAMWSQTHEIKPTQETLLQNFYIIYFKQQSSFVKLQHTL